MASIRSRTLAVLAIVATLIAVLVVVPERPKVSISLRKPDEAYRIYHPDGTSIVRPPFWRARSLIFTDSTHVPNQFVLEAGRNTIQVAWPIELSPAIPSSADELAIPAAGRQRAIHFTKKKLPHRGPVEESVITIWADYSLGKTTARCRAEFWCHGEEPSEIAAPILSYLDTLRFKD